MPEDGLAEGAPRGRPRRLVIGLAQRPIAFERELGVDDNRSRRIGQTDQAIGAPVVRERGLERVGRRRQGILHEIAKLHLAEGATGMLVGQDILQADHLARQLLAHLGDVLLRLVDDGQACLELAQGFRRLGRRLLKAVTERLGELVEPARQRNLGLGEGIDGLTERIAVVLTAPGQQGDHDAGKNQTEDESNNERNCVFHDRWSSGGSINPADGAATLSRPPDRRMASA